MLLSAASIQACQLCKTAAEFGCNRGLSGESRITGGCNMKLFKSVVCAALIGAGALLGTSSTLLAMRSCPPGYHMGWTGGYYWDGYRWTRGYNCMPGPPAPGPPWWWTGGDGGWTGWGWGWWWLNPLEGSFARTSTNRPLGGTYSTNPGWGAAANSIRQPSGDTYYPAANSISRPSGGTYSTNPAWGGAANSTSRPSGPAGGGGNSYYRPVGGTSGYTH
jgi:hypothetical protein